MNEIYWNNYPSSAVNLTLENEKFFLIFEGKSSEYGSHFSGKITLHKNLNEQVATGSIYYQYENGSQETFPYKLIGAFEDDSWEFFTGTWEENCEIYPFDALLEVVELEELELKVLETTENIIEVDSLHNYKEEKKAKKVSERLGAMRQRAARSDARVRKIQRSMELYYGLPQGSVRLVNPDRTLIHPSAKIGTLRDRWISEEV